MAKKKIPWYDKHHLKPKYIETPLTKYVGGHDKIVWPYFGALLFVGTIIVGIFL